MEGPVVGPEPALAARICRAWRCAIARACARGAGFVAVDGFDDPRAIRWNVRVVGIAWPGSRGLHGDIRRLGIAAARCDQRGPLKIVSGRVVEANCGRAAGDRKRRGQPQDRRRGSQRVCAQLSTDRAIELTGHREYGRKALGGRRRSSRSRCSASCARYRPSGTGRRRSTGAPYRTGSPDAAPDARASRDAERR